MIPTLYELALALTALACIALAVAWAVELAKELT